MNPKTTYAAARISDDAKTMIARLYRVQHAQGKRRHEFVADMSQAGYTFSESQLDRWVARVNRDEAAISTTKASGAPAHLTREQRDIAGGWILSQNFHGISVHRSDYSHFCDEHFKQPLSHPTVSRYLAEDGFSYRTMQSKARGFTVDIVSAVNSGIGYRPNVRRAFSTFIAAFSPVLTSLSRGTARRGVPALPVRGDRNRY